MRNQAVALCSEALHPDLAVVVVNFNSGEYLAGCIDALRQDLQDGLQADIVVVDNASPVSQDTWLAGLDARGARVFRRKVNDGYAGGCQFGLSVTDAPLLCFMNADVRFRPRALAVLRRYVAARPEVGFAEPRFFIDDGCQWLQPSFVPPTALRLLGEAAARFSPRIARHRERNELRRQVRGWVSSSVTSCLALSGAALVTRREVMTLLGGFDTGYPLAYEDTDLFARAREAGFALTTVPHAEAIHYAHRSRVTVPEDSIRKDALGRQRYLRRHVGAFATCLDRLGRGMARASRRARPPFLELGGSVEPLEFELHGPSGRFLLLLAYDESFAVYAGHFGEGSTYRFPAESWRSLLPSSVFVRAFALEDLAPRGAWRFQAGPRCEGGAGA